MDTNTNTPTEENECIMKHFYGCDKSIRNDMIDCRKCNERDLNER